MSLQFYDTDNKPLYQANIKIEQQNQILNFQKTKIEFTLQIYQQNIKYIKLVPLQINSNINWDKITVFLMSDQWINKLDLTQVVNSDCINFNYEYVQCIYDCNTCIIYCENENQHEFIQGFQISQQVNKIPDGQQSDQSYLLQIQCKQVSIDQQIDQNYKKQVQLIKHLFKLQQTDVQQDVNITANFLVNLYNLKPSQEYNQKIVQIQQNVIIMSQEQLSKEIYINKFNLSQNNTQIQLLNNYQCYYQQDIVMYNFETKIYLSLLTTSLNLIKQDIAVYRQSQYQQCIFINQIPMFILIQLARKTNKPLNNSTILQQVSKEKRKQYNVRIQDGVQHNVIDQFKQEVLKTLQFTVGQIFTSEQKCQEPVQLKYVKKNKLQNLRLLFNLQPDELKLIENTEQLLDYVYNEKRYKLKEIKNILLQLEQVQ